MPDGDTEAWNLVMVSKDADVGEGPQGAPEEGSGTAALGGSPESIIHAVCDLLAKMGKPSGENSSY